MDREQIATLLGPFGRKRIVRIVLLVVVAGALEAVTVTAVYPFLVVATRPATVPTSGALSRLYELSGTATPREFLLALGGGILFLVVATNVMGAYSAWQQQKATSAFEHDLSVRLLHRFLSRRYPFFLQRNSSELQRLLIQDCHAVTTGLVEPGLEIVARSIAAAAILAVLLVVQPGIALGALVLFAGVSSVAYWFGRRRRASFGQRLHEARKEAARASADALSAIKPLKSTGREAHFLHRFERADRWAGHYYANENMLARLPRYLLEGLVMVVVISLLLTIIATGGDLVSYLPAIGMFTFAGFRLLPAIHGITLSIGHLRFNESVIAGIAKELRDDGGSELLEPVAALPLRKEIRFEDVRFTYEGSEQEVLQGVDICIPKGSSVGLVGRTGSGKSTIMDLTLGLLKPTGGRITVDGTPIDFSNARRWRASISYVPQQVVLLDDTLSRNVAFGVPDEEIDMPRVRRACEAADILAFIEKDLPEGFATIVGERGVRLSGGQRQRIGIARALYEDREVIVFDEATSEVDAPTERAINSAIGALAHEKTILVVAHRFSAIRRCDQIYVVDGGRIVARGKYDDLVATEARFREMAKQ